MQNSATRANARSIASDLLHLAARSSHQQKCDALRRSAFTSRCGEARSRRTAAKRVHVALRRSAFTIRKTERCAFRDARARLLTEG